MTLHRMIHKLRLKPGDIPVLRDGADYNLFDRIIQAGRNSGIRFNVPIIRVGTRQDLNKIPFEILERTYNQAKESKDASTGK